VFVVTNLRFVKNPQLECKRNQSKVTESITKFSVCLAVFLETIFNVLVEPCHRLVIVPAHGSINFTQPKLSHIDGLRLSLEHRMADEEVEKVFPHFNPIPSSIISLVYGTIVTHFFLPIYPIYPLSIMPP
jgi:hypothetical protein